MSTTEPRRSRGSGGGVELRLHAALAIPGDCARELAAEAERLAAVHTGTVPVGAAELHLTFAFLGSVAEEHVGVVAAALDAAAAAVPGPTAVELGPLVPFGAGDVLAARAHLELHAVLDGVRDRFLDAVRPYAPSLDSRAWHPHVSLVRGVRAMDRPTEPRTTAASLPTWITTELRLVASLPAPGGSTHRVLHAVPFGIHAPIA